METIILLGEWFCILGVDHDYKDCNLIGLGKKGFMA